MNEYEQLQVNQWNQLEDEEKWELFQQVLHYFVDSKLPIQHIELCTFKMAGAVCRTFTLEIDQESFVFIPGHSNVILGWNHGAESIPEHAFFWQELSATTELNRSSELSQEDLLKLAISEEVFFDLTTYEGISEYVDAFTTRERVANVEPMLLSRSSLPIQAVPKGQLQIVSGEYTGDREFFGFYGKELIEIVYPQLPLEEMLDYQFPEEIFRRGEYYLKRLPYSDTYQVFQLRDASFDDLLTHLKHSGFSLPTEDQWEYAAGLGSRRLLRWGNEWNLQEQYGVNAAYKKVRKQNIFGLYYNWKSNYHELTNDPNIVKLEISHQPASLPIQNLLPLSTYYRNYKASINSSTILNPFHYYYRKVIVIKDWT